MSSTPARCWCKILYTTICGAQINEIEAAKGPDKFLPHLLGHEASATVIETGPGVTHVQAGRHAWCCTGGRARASSASRRPTSGAASKLNAGWVTTFNEYAVVSENRMTVIPPDYDLKSAPLLGCAVTTAAGVINNDAKVQDRRVGGGVRRRRRRPQRRAVRRAGRRAPDRRGRSARQQARHGEARAARPTASTPRTSRTWMPRSARSSAPRARTR